MMRGAVYLLLLLNLVIGLWYGMQAQDQPAATDHSLLLLSERTQGRVESVRPVEPRRPVCFSLGPFDSRAGAEARLAALHDALDVYGFHETQGGEPRAYRVYRPGLDSPEAARSEAEKLHAMGIDDVFVMSGGGGQYGLSLGVFSTAERARRWQRQLQAMGVPVRTVALQELRRYYWLDVGFSEPPQAALLGAQRDGGEEIIKMSCEGLL